MRQPYRVHQTQQTIQHLTLPSIVAKLAMWISQTRCRWAASLVDRVARQLSATGLSCKEAQLAAVKGWILLPALALEDTNQASKQEYWGFCGGGKYTTEAS
jgi:hypothetical protein